jgi:hypothetical protein
LIALVLTFALFWITRMPGRRVPGADALADHPFVRLVPRKAFEPPERAARAGGAGAMFARSGSEKTGYLKALPTALVIAALAFTALPAGSPTWKTLADAADRVRQMFFDYFMFTDARASTRCTRDGYHPLGDSLGRPCGPSEENIMLVQTDGCCFCRGSIRRNYTPIPGPTAPSTIATSSSTPPSRASGTAHL